MLFNGNHLEVCTRKKECFLPNKIPSPNLNILQSTPKATLYATAILLKLFYGFQQIRHLQ